MPRTKKTRLTLEGGYASEDYEEATSSVAFSCFTPYVRQSAWALKSVTQRVAHTGGKMKLETFHREKVIEIGKRCIKEQNWKVAAQIAAFLIQLGSEFNSELSQSNKRRGLRYALDRSTRYSLLDIRRIVMEVALHFPDLFSHDLLSKFDRHIYRGMNIEHKKIAIKDILVHRLVKHDPARAYLEVQQLRGSSRTSQQSLMLGIIKYQEWLKSLKNDLKGRIKEDLLATIFLDKISLHRWSTVTKELYQDAKSLLQETLTSREIHDFGNECLLMNRLAHLYLAVKKGEEFSKILLQYMTNYREVRHSKAYLVHLQLLVSFIQSQLGTDEMSIKNMAELAEQDPFSPMPVHYLSEQSFSTFAENIPAALQISFLHLDVCPSRLKAWYCLALTLHVAVDESKCVFVEEETSFLGDLWQSRHSWWMRCHFHPKLLEKTVKKESNHGIAIYKTICAMYLKTTSASAMYNITCNLDIEQKGQDCLKMWKGSELYSHEHRQNLFIVEGGNEKVEQKCLNVNIKFV